MTDTRLAVPDVSRAHCERAILGALASLTGVELATVDVGGRAVAVKHDPQTAPVESIARAIEEQGYTVTGHTSGAAVRQ